MWQPSERYPDPAIQVLDPRFARYRLPLAAVERLATGCRWAEGPVWFGDGRYRAVERYPQRPHPEMGGVETGTVSVFRKPVMERQRQYA